MQSDIRLLTRLQQRQRVPDARDVQDLVRTVDQAKEIVGVFDIPDHLFDLQAGCVQRARVRAFAHEAAQRPIKAVFNKLLQKIAARMPRNAGCRKDHGLISLQNQMVII